MLLPRPHGAVPQFEEINVESLELHSLLLSRANLYPSESIKPNVLALNDNQNIQGRWLFPIYKVAELTKLLLSRCNGNGW